MRKMILAQRRLAHYRRLDDAFRPIPACRCDPVPDLEQLALTAYPVPSAVMTAESRARHLHFDLCAMTPAQLGRESYRCTLALAYASDPHPWHVERMERIADELRERGQERRL